MTTDITCRVAASNDLVGILKVFEEVAPEVPTRVYPETKGYIDAWVGTGKSWVATDANGTIVGYALAEGDDKALSLIYLGVSKAARGQGVCSSLISKLKGARVSINTDVRSDNKSSMVDRFLHFGFVKGNIDKDRTKLHWISQ
ncbi:GNAT family N-acetyltransferase [Bradyrhizobium sp. CCBAU 65884]|uniref:GNAT family N-acetyltransferase n=1 Tax=Bradyrhizobium sp. CCBAU 65884 TaxID=722477 RepID=UPI0023052FC7|nr:GNAT family N-acetyltransferase [Bradyrhizobium sp. CCBAU 65884]